MRLCTVFILEPVNVRRQYVRFMRGQFREVLSLCAWVSLKWQAHYGNLENEFGALISGALQCVFYLISDTRLGAVRLFFLRLPRSYRSVFLIRRIYVNHN